jgi:ATP-dependent exoDNAse (exonuclease V) beta subunit
VRRAIRKPSRPGPGGALGSEPGELDRAASAAERARAAARPPLARPSGLSESDEEHASPDGDADESLPARALHARELARAAGTALHDVLERWSFRNPNTARALLRSAATRAARLASVSEDEVLAQAGPALDALLSSGLPAALGKLEVLGRELPLLFEEPDGTRWNGTIDLLYRDPADGRWWSPTTSPRPRPNAPTASATAGSSRSTRAASRASSRTSSPPPPS